MAPVPLNWALAQVATVSLNCAELKSLKVKCESVKACLPPMGRQVLVLKPVALLLVDFSFQLGFSQSRLSKEGRSKASIGWLISTYHAVISNLSGDLTASGSSA